jgi:acyl dehydratase
MSVPTEVEGWIGQARYSSTANFPVERGYLWSSCASVENGNPLFWDDAVADELTGGPVAPPTTLSLWMRPHHWEPGAAGPRLPLQLHFDLKEQLGLPEAVISDSVVTFGEPVRPGDVIGTREVLRSVSPAKATKLGHGRFWVIDVEYRNQAGVVVGVESYTGFGYRRGGGTRTAAQPVSPAPSRYGAPLPGDPAAKPEDPANRAHGHLTLADVAVGDRLPTLRHDVTATTVVLGAMASRDWRPMHHDVHFAVHRNGTRDIFLNTPTQQAWFERFVTDWTGPRGRLGRLRFRMLDSVFPGDTMVITGTIEAVATDATGCGWADVALQLHADDRLCTTGQLRVAVPTGAGDNPWDRHGDRWQPDPDRPLPDP